MTGIGAVSDVKYFEDFTPGDVIDCGTRIVTREEIIAFAKDYDPNRIHIDPEYAAKTPLGDVMGSGIHMMGVAMSAAVRAYLFDSAAIASPGADILRFMAPMLPGAELRTQLRILDAKPSESRNDRGVVKLSFELFHGEKQLLEWVAPAIFRRRHPAAA
jgi:acyl dehydratase